MKCGFNTGRFYNEAGQRITTSVIKLEAGEAAVVFCKDAVHFALAPMYAYDFVTQTKSGMTDESFFSCSC